MRLNTVQANLERSKSKGILLLVFKSNCPYAYKEIVVDSNDYSSETYLQKWICAVNEILGTMYSRSDLLPDGHLWGSNESIYFPLPKEIASLPDDEKNLTISNLIKKVDKACYG